MRFFHRRKEGFRKHAVVYIARSGSKVLVAAMHYNGADGVLIEGDDVRSISGVEDVVSLSETVLSAIDRSSVRPERNLGDRTLRDWPTFRESGVRSVRRFHAEYVRIQVSGENEANVSLRIEGDPEPNADLTVCCTVAPFSPRVGEACLEVWKACRDRRF